MNKRNHRIISIRSRLAISQSLLLILLALVIGTASYLIMSSHIEKAERAKLRGNALAAANIVRNFIDSKSELLTRIVQNSAVEKYYKAYNLPALQAYLEQFSATFPIITCVNDKGLEEAKILNGTPSLKLFDLSGNSHYQAITTTPNQSIFSAPRESALLAKPVVDIGYLYLNYFGEKIGPVIISIPLADIAAVFKELQFESNIHFVITNPNGKIIYAEEPKWLMRGLTEIENTDDEFESLLNKKEVDFGMYHLASNDYVVSMATIQDHNWKVFATVPTQTFKAPLDTLRNYVILASGVLLIIGLVLSSVLGSKITAPIRQLDRVTSDIATTGDLSRRVTPSTHDELGQLAKSFNTMIDQLQHINQEIADERSFTAGIISSMADSLIVTTPEGIIEKVNKATLRLLDYEEHNLLGKPLHLVLSETENLLKPENEGVEKIAHLETNYINANGTETPVSLTGSRMIEGEIVLVAKDITERQRLDQMKNEFISTVSHELRTPLTSIQGALGLIKGGVAGIIPNEMEDLFKIANDNTQRLLLLINDILDLQKIESGELKFNIQELEVIPFLEQAIVENSAYAEQYKVSFIITSSVANSRILADEARLMQVMNNLMSNASKFSPPGGQVELSAQRHNNIIRISIRDHGPGIPEEFHDKIFDKFSQADASDSRQKGGTGLGLNIAKQIIEKHSGNIGFSTSKDAGTTFYFELPEPINIDHKDIKKTFKNLNRKGTKEQRKDY